MRIYKKDVFYGSKFINNLNQKSIFNKISNKITIWKTKPNIIFIKLNDDCYIELDDAISAIENSKLPKNMALKSVHKYKTHPTKDGEFYVANLKHYFKLDMFNENEKIDITAIEKANISTNENQSKFSL